MFPVGNVGSIPNFDRVIEPHSWLRGWSRITNSYSRWHTASILQNVGNAITCLSMERFGWNLGVHIPPCPGHVCHDAVAMATAVALATAHQPLPSNSALYIQQLWASGGRTHEPILMKFGIQQQIRTTMTVTWSNIKILKIQMADDRHVGKYSKCCNSPTNGPTETQLGWSHPIISPTCPPRFGCHVA